MMIEERLEEILKFLNEKGKATVKEISAILGVSPDTIRRDFIRLSDKNLVLRTHGGIISKKSILFDPSMNEKITKFKKEKELIAKKATSFINNSEVVIIDAGTTTEKIINNLKNNRDITVLTNALNVANNTIKYPEITTIIIGGTIRNDTLSIIGPDSINMIKKYHAEKLFLAISAISIKNGLMTPNRMEAEIKKELMSITDEVIVLADSSKINKKSLFSFCEIKDISTLITDKNADEKFIDTLKKMHIEVIIADD